MNDYYYFPFELKLNFKKVIYFFLIYMKKLNMLCMVILTSFLFIFLGCSSGEKEDNEVIVDIEEEPNVEVLEDELNIESNDSDIEILYEREAIGNFSNDSEIGSQFNTEGKDNNIESKENDIEDKDNSIEDKDDNGKDISIKTNLSNENNDIYTEFAESIADLDGLFDGLTIEDWCIVNKEYTIEYEGTLTNITIVGPTEFKEEEYCKAITILSISGIDMNIEYYFKEGGNKMWVVTDLFGYKTEEFIEI